MTKQQEGRQNSDRRWRSRGPARRSSPAAKPSPKNQGGDQEGRRGKVGAAQQAINEQGTKQADTRSTMAKAPGGSDPEIQRQLGGPRATRWPRPGSMPRRRFLGPGWPTPSINAQEPWRCGRERLPATGRAGLFGADPEEPRRPDLEDHHRGICGGDELRARRARPGRREGAGTWSTSRKPARRSFRTRRCGASGSAAGWSSRRRFVFDDNRGAVICGAGGKADDDLRPTARRWAPGSMAIRGLPGAQPPATSLDPGAIGRRHDPVAERIPRGIKWSPLQLDQGFRRPRHRRSVGRPSGSSPARLQIRRERRASRSLGAAYAPRGGWPLPLHRAEAERGASS